MNRKGQFGPDVLISILIVAIVGLGGVFFLNTFVKGLELKAFVDIADQEQDMSCFLSLSALTKKDYIRSGKNVSNFEQDYVLLQNYFGGYNEKMDYSLTFEREIKTLNNTIGKIGKKYFNVTSVDGIMGKYEFVSYKKKFKSPCIYSPIYSPAGYNGIAYLQVNKKK